MMRVEATLASDLRQPREGLVFEFRNSPDGQLVAATARSNRFAVTAQSGQDAIRHHASAASAYLGDERLKIRLGAVLAMAMEELLRVMAAERQLVDVTTSSDSYR